MRAFVWRGRVVPVAARAVAPLAIPYNARRPQPERRTDLLLPRTALGAHRRDGCRPLRAVARPGLPLCGWPSPSGFGFLSGRGPWIRAASRGHLRLRAAWACWGCLAVAAALALPAPPATLALAQGPSRPLGAYTLLSGPRRLLPTRTCRWPHGLGSPRWTFSRPLGLIAWPIAIGPAPSELRTPSTGWPWRSRPSPMARSREQERAARVAARNRARYPRTALDHAPGALALDGGPEGEALPQAFFQEARASCEAQSTFEFLRPCASRADLAMLAKPIPSPPSSTKAPCAKRPSSGKRPGDSASSAGGQITPGPRGPPLGLVPGGQGVKIEPAIGCSQR